MDFCKISLSGLSHLDNKVVYVVKFPQDAGHGADKRLLLFYDIPNGCVMLRVGILKEICVDIFI